MRTIKHSLTLAWCLLLLPAASISAQGTAEPSEPIRPWRVLAIGDAAFLDSFKPITTSGFLYQVATSKTKFVEKPVTEKVITVTGMKDTTYMVREEIAPTIYCHTLASGGISWKSGGVKFSGFGQLGLMRRTESKIFKVFGIAAQGISEPLGGGPIARVEIKDNLGIQAGWIFYKGSGDGFFMAIDFYKRLRQSTGFLINAMPRARW